MLKLGWSDSATLIPLDFSSLSSTKANINGIEERIDVIGVVKVIIQRYLVDNKWVDLKNLYKLATPTNHRKNILHSIQNTMANGIPAKVEFFISINFQNDFGTTLTLTPLPIFYCEHFKYISLNI